MELMPDAPTDPQISPLIAKFAKSLAEYRSSVVGSHNLCLPDGMDACREGECLGGMVMTDAMLAYARPYGATIALCNGGGIRAALPAKVTRGDLLSMLPFGGSVVVRKVSGQHILEALEHGVSQENGKGPRLLQASGLSYVVDPAGRPGERVSNVMVKDAMGKSVPLDVSASYVLALPGFWRAGGTGTPCSRKARSFRPRNFWMWILWNPGYGSILRFPCRKQGVLCTDEQGGICRLFYSFNRNACK